VGPHADGDFDDPGTILGGRPDEHLEFGHSNFEEAEVEVNFPLIIGAPLVNRFAALEEEPIEDCDRHLLLQVVAAVFYAASFRGKHNERV